MIEWRKGNLFESGAEALVNTVNTVGVMGKGVALQFKEIYPDNFKQYEQAALKGEIEVGKMFVVEYNAMNVSTRYIINFPTKKHYRHPSKLEYVINGLRDLRQVIERFKISSVALPPLGCGNGGLDWADVKPLIESALADLPNTHVYVYEPDATIYKTLTRKDNPNRTVSLTPARTMILKAMDIYSVLDFEITLIEVQKLVYFLQRLGADFKRLTFTANFYGPFSPMLNQMLFDIEGRYIRGLEFKDAKPLAEIEIIAGKENDLEQAFTKLAEQDRAALKDTERLIDGFESPLGLELLATADWVLAKQPETRESLEAMIHAVHNWTVDGKIITRKKKFMTPYMLEVTRKRLMQFADKLYP